MKITVTTFVNLFETDGGMVMEDSGIKAMDCILTTCRALAGIASDMAEDKVEHLENIVTTFESHGCKKRSCMSLMCGALVASDYW